ncbi:hypothetical protein N7468_008944 [Penicillium chermesinum]|uniref:Heme-binding peroxidase n=1 Tax=Penicillium chermesinum TaxID=63820 RepID=A0A9W9TFM8_9EURO|nr:uncharacterized protein N7468_008944 [Penicillium chermesinum]KAJ5219740.1 hypothetical protein N7468_008944 [Penicillium chermesinum]KAJ6153737.1 hypothetical protein N7470_006696 [Penicillium chermesinum]
MAEETLYSRLRRVIKEPHAAIHRINLSRLPLCLPPNASQPTLYALGLSRYAELYFGVEAEWVACTGEPIEWIAYFDVHQVHAIDDTERVRALLRLLYMPEIPRTKPLEADIAFLSAMNTVRLEQFHAQNPGSRIREQIRQRVRGHPHRLVAYIWIMYSALLYGGDRILGLLKAYPAFWDLSRAELESDRTPTPLSFWHIDDSVTVKEKFRDAMANLDQFLTPKEQEDILDESLLIFLQFNTLTSRLDDEAQQFRDQASAPSS